MDAKQIATENLIFECMAGSHAYGTSTPTSDVDKRGICIAPPDIALSCVKGFDQYEDPDSDRVIYELKKFVKLAADNNPNIIELLFTGEENILYCHPAFARIRQNAHLFLSKKAKFTFSGYAMAQLKRIKGHNKWINNPASEVPPLLSEFCKLVDVTGATIKDREVLMRQSQKYFLVQFVGQSIYKVYQSKDDNFHPGWFNHDETDIKYIDISDEKLSERDVIYKGLLFVNFEEFKKDRTNWKDYWTWKNNRNPARAVLEEKFNYDVKHAMHLVRLMCMCKEILTEGKVIVRRPDAQYLLDIRGGKYDYEWIMKWADDTDKSLDEMYEKSTLPHSVDWNAIDNLYQETIREYWHQKYPGWHQTVLQQDEQEKTSEH
jgi:hypothetical protein